MKLYSFSFAPNARRVTAFLNEKGIEVDTYELNVREGEQFKEPYQTMNPFNCVPFLKLDNGLVISESLSICRYLENLHPYPSLFGDSPEKISYIDMWNRRLELNALAALGQAVRNKLPFFEGKVLAGTRNDIKQSPEIVNRARDILNDFCERVNPHLKDKSFICGSDFTVADITGYFIFPACDALDFKIDSKYENVLKWKDTISNRDCFKFD